MDWLNFSFAKFDGAVTICDSDLIIKYMNQKAAESFQEYGGFELIGENLLDCHNENSRAGIHRMMNTGKPNIYTIEKKGIKKLIYQSPLTENGKASALIELSLEIPSDMPHFIRD